MKKNVLALYLLGYAALFCSVTHAAEEDVSKRDPARWYQADDTPQLRYQNLQKEANAAYGQALQECKSGARADARQCRADAQANLKDDMARAKRIRAHAEGDSGKAM